MVGFVCQPVRIDPANGFTNNNMMETNSGGGGPVIGSSAAVVVSSDNGEGFKKQPREFEFVFGCESIQQRPYTSK